MSQQKTSSFNLCGWVGGCGCGGDGEGGGYTIMWVFNHSTWFKWVAGWWAMATANGECVSPACVRLWCVYVCVRACARVCVCRGAAGWGSYRDMFFHMIFIVWNFIRMCFYYVIVNYDAAGCGCVGGGGGGGYGYSDG